MFGDRFGSEGFTDSWGTMEDADEALAFAFDEVVEAVGAVGVRFDERGDEFFLVGGEYELAEDLVVPFDGA